MTYHHLSVLVHRQAEKYGDKVALKYRDYETAQWIPISWKQFSGSVLSLIHISDSFRLSM